MTTGEPYDTEAPTGHTIRKGGDLQFACEHEACSSHAERHDDGEENDSPHHTAA